MKSKSLQKNYRTKFVLSNDFHLPLRILQVCTFHFKHKKHLQQILEKFYKTQFSKPKSNASRKLEFNLHSPIVPYFISATNKLDRFKYPAKNKRDIDESNSLTAVILVPGFKFSKILLLKN